MKFYSKQDNDASHDRTLYIRYQIWHIFDPYHDIKGSKFDPHPHTRNFNIWYLIICQNRAKQYSKIEYKTVVLNVVLPDWMKWWLCEILMMRRIFLDTLNKRYFRIDQHYARNFVNYGAGLSSPPPFFLKVKLHLNLKKKFHIVTIIIKFFPNY